MNKSLVLRALVVIGVAVAITACGSDDTPETPDANDADATQDSGDTNAEDTADDGDTANDTDEEQGAPAETTIPAGAVAATESFPFPVPEGWTERIAFEAIQIGASDAMSATYEFTEDFATAATPYKDLLNAAGFTSDTYLPGEMTNEASITADGAINGVNYSGLIDFDTHADGYQRASINLVVE